MRLGDEALVSRRRVAVAKKKLRLPTRGWKAEFESTWIGR
jgi:hypothetical protein